MMLLGALTFAFAANARAEETEPWLSWQTPLQSGHPLAGQIWSAGEERFITPPALANALAETKLVLIGESHDNADHHRLQGWLIRAIAKGRTPAIVMEMINRDQAAALDAYLARPDADAAGLGPALDWAKSGWPDWSMYQPIAEAALPAKLRIVAGNPSPATIRSISRGGLGSLEEDERKSLALDRPLSPALAEALSDDIRESHCGLLPEASIGPMTQVQRYRDAALAEALLEAGENDSAILIAGNGHVRSDRGVPWYLFRLAPDASMASVVLLEITDDAQTIDDLIMAGPGGTPVADYFWFTPRAEREDPCEGLRQHFQK